MDADMEEGSEEGEVEGVVSYLELHSQIGHLRQHRRTNTVRAVEMRVNRQICPIPPLVLTIPKAGPYLKQSMAMTLKGLLGRRLQLNWPKSVRRHRNSRSP